MKNITVPVAVAIAIIGCVLAVNASVNMSRIDQVLEQERFNRLSAEQKLQAAQKSIKQLVAELDDSRKKIKNIEDIINQGRSTTSDLQVQLQKEAEEKSKLMGQVQQLQQTLGQLEKAKDQMSAPLGNQ
ncbi:MAG TPA: hypothetical protein PLB05_01785 [Candidatus Omnitrophota bacterium]|nr:hypothetical protein [Candidatus Omnitrophota bacterium]HPN55414.1 hypothetical protein [Candidatus Omnitrophota bacterium]